MKKARKEGKIRSRDRFSETRIRKILFDSMNRRNGIQKTRGGRERERENEREKLWNPIRERIARSEEFSAREKKKRKKGEKKRCNLL